MENKRFRVFESFNVGFVSEIDAKDEEEAISLHNARVEKLTPEEYYSEIGEGVGDSDFEVEEIERE